jgi:hypothetical protein
MVDDVVLHFALIGMLGPAETDIEDIGFFVIVNHDMGKR